MATIPKFGPADHGKPMSLAEFEAGDYEEGYKYELIDGRLYVSPEANFPEHWLERWLVRRLDQYSLAHPEVINFIANKGRVFVPDRRRPTCPAPDIAAYHDLPLDQPIRLIDWQEASPVLVVEILVEGDANKDLVRNVDLYFEVPAIREYWLIDGRDNPEEPSLKQHRRHGKRWVIREYPFGSTFTTRLLPGFSLAIDPRR